MLGDWDYKQSTTTQLKYNVKEAEIITREIEGIDSATYIDSVGTLRRPMG